VVVGFAAETGDAGADVLTHARAKLARKGCDLLVVNDVSGGAVFGHARNAVTILDAGGGARQVPEDSKEAVADAVWDAVAALLPPAGPADTGTPAPR
jgi:phosphopantothenoylcysteine decarboxylase/phosphopantothenate--cysteine ligase